MRRFHLYVAGQTTCYYGTDHQLVPIITAHGTTVGYLPGQSVALYRDGFLQEVTVHESAYDARAYATARTVEARRCPLPHLRDYKVI